jgi:hypothetical protein
MVVIIPTKALHDNRKVVIVGIAVYLFPPNKAPLWRGFIVLVISPYETGTERLTPGRRSFARIAGLPGIA